MPDDLEKLQAGDEIAREFTFTAEHVAAFSQLVGDKAPVHFDAGFAREQGFDDRIVHGLLVGSVFSGMLGEDLPGPRSVINALSLKYHKPVYLGQTLHYQVKIRQVSPAARAVVLALGITNADGEKIVSGQSTCSFPK